MILTCLVMIRHALLQINLLLTANTNLGHIIYINTIIKIDSLWFIKEDTRFMVFCSMSLT